MIFLVLAVICSTCNQLLFKAFARFRVNLLSAIVANYAACVVIGFSSSNALLWRGVIFTQVWYPYSILQGALFVVCLFLLGRTTARQGVAIASLATRLSVVIPTIAAFMLYGDLLTVFKIGGILASLLALYLSSTDSAKAALHSRSILPLSLFAAFGAYSILIKLVQEKFLTGSANHIYIMFSFLAAFLLSGSLLAWRLIKKKQACQWRDLIWGCVLGCSNYGAVYFLIRALSIPGWQSSQLFPTVSIAVVTLSTLGAWALFNERLNRRILIALAIGVGSIALVNL